MSTITFTTQPIPPFRLDLTVWALKRRPEYVVDDWDGLTYRRVLRVNGVPVALAIQQRGSLDEPELEIEASPFTDASVGEHAVASEVRRLLGTELDLSAFYRLAADDEQLNNLVRRFRGFKPPRYPSIFECLTNAITCQLLSLNVGLRVVSRLVEHYGPRISPDTPPAFPNPTEIAAADPDHLRSIGFSRQKARALIELAQGIDAGRIDLEALADLDDREAVKYLTSLRGVGRWTAEYALLRGMGRLHVFPGDDVGARNTLQLWAGTDQPLTYDGVAELLDRWKQYAGLLYFHMLLLGLDSKGRFERR